MKEKFEELAKGEPGAAAAEAVLVGEVMVSDSSSSWTLAMLGERPELKPPKGPEPPGKVDSAIVERNGGFVVCVFGGGEGFGGRGGGEIAQCWVMGGCK